LAAEILGFPAPIAVPAMTLMAAVLLNSLRRHLRGGRVHQGTPSSRRRLLNDP
jgi:hypothetical protein